MPDVPSESAQFLNQDGADAIPKVTSSTPPTPPPPASGAKKDDNTVKLPNLIAQLEVECVTDGVRWFGDVARDPSYIAICLGGEVGEVLNEVKKHIRGSTNIETARQRVAEEIVDVLIYTLHLGALMDVDLFELYKKKRAYNEERFGGKAAGKHDGTSEPTKPGV